MFDGVSVIIIDYDSGNWLPMVTSRNLNLQLSPSINLCITSGENQKLTLAKKRLLLHWHSTFGHCNLRDVQFTLRSPPFRYEHFLVCNRISFEDRPLCEV